MKKGIISILIAGSVGAIGASINAKKKVAEKQMLADKHLALFLLMNQWVGIKQREESIAEYLVNKGYHKIAIYGMSYVGETLVCELKNSEVNVMCAIDKNAEQIYSEVNIITSDDNIPDVDAIVVTAITAFDEIEEILSAKTNADILSIEDILYEI